MKKLLSLALLASSFVSATTSYQATDDINRRLQTSTGAFTQYCNSYKNRNVYSSITFTSSKCFTTSKSMEYVKEIVDIYYGDELTGGWNRVGNRFNNLLSLDNHLIELTISPSDPDGKQGTFVIITNLESVAHLREFNAKKKQTFAKLGLPSDSYTNGAHPKGVRYFDIMQNLDDFSLIRKNQYLVAKFKNNEPSFKVNSTQALFNGKPITLPGTPYLRAENIFIPTSVIAQLGCSIVDAYFTETTIEADCGGDFSSLFSVETTDLWAP